MFFSVNRINATDAEKIRAYQLFRIAKELTSSQLLLLKACYQVRKDGKLAALDGQRRGLGRVYGASRNDWLEMVQQVLGHGVRALIARDEEKLGELWLLDRNTEPVGPYISASAAAAARLTDLGLCFCENIETYSIEVSKNTET